MSDTAQELENVRYSRAGIFERLIYYLECQIATEYHFINNKRAPKFELARHDGEGCSDSSCGRCY